VEVDPWQSAAPEPTSKQIDSTPLETISVASAAGGDHEQLDHRAFDDVGPVAGGPVVVRSDEAEIAEALLGPVPAAGDGVAESKVDMTRIVSKVRFAPKGSGDVLTVHDHVDERVRHGPSERGVARPGG